MLVPKAHVLAKCFSSLFYCGSSQMLCVSPITR